MPFSFQKLPVITGSIARSATRRYTEADFEGFRPGRATHCTDPKTLSVCLSVTLLNDRVCAPDFVMKALEYRNDIDAVG